MSGEPNPITPTSSPSSLPASISGDSPKTLADIVREVAPEALGKIPEEKQSLLVTVNETRHVHSVRSAPLPEPSELAAYNSIIPNGADRILKMAEAQSAHRIQIEALVISSQQKQGFCGQLFALIIALTVVVCATFAAISGQPTFASIIGGTALVSITSAFLYTRHSQKRELTAKQPQMPQGMTPHQLPSSPQSQNRKKKNRRR